MGKTKDNEVKGACGRSTMADICKCINNFQSVYNFFGLFMWIMTINLKNKNKKNNDDRGKYNNNKGEKMKRNKIKY